MKTEAVERMETLLASEKKELQNVVTKYALEIDKSGGGHPPFLAFFTLLDLGLEMSFIMTGDKERAKEFIDNMINANLDSYEKAAKKSDAMKGFDFSKN